MREERIKIGILSLLAFLSMLNLTLIIPSLQEFIIERLSASQTEASLFVTLEMVAYVIFGVVWGAISDIRGKRKGLIVAGYACSSVLYFMMTLAPDITTLLIIRFTQGAVTIMSWSLVMTLALDYTRSQHLGRGMGIVGMGFIFGIAAGAPIGGFIAELGIFIPVYAASLAFLLAAAISFFLLEEPKLPTAHRPYSIKDAFRSLLREKRIAVPYAFGFLERYSAGYFVFLFPLMLDAKFDASPATRGLYLAAFLIPFALLQYPFGRISDRYGRTPFLIFGGIAYALLFMSVGFLEEQMLVYIMIFCGLLAAMLFPASLALVGDISPPSERGTYMGGFNVFGSMGFAIGPLSSAIASEFWGYGESFAFGGVIILLLVVITIPMLRSIHRTSSVHSLNSRNEY